MLDIDKISNIFCCFIFFTSVNLFKKIVFNNLGGFIMDDDIFNPRKRLLTDKETVELVEIVEATIDVVSSNKTRNIVSSLENDNKYFIYINFLIDYNNH